MPKPLYDDPVVAEIHAIREQMLAECGDDYQKFMEQLRERQRGSGRKVIPAPPPAMPAATPEPRVVVLEPRKPGQPSPRIRSPRLSHPEQAADFVMEVYPEDDEGS